MANLHPYAKKSNWVVGAHADGPEFLAIDRKVFNVLLANAYNALRNQSGAGIHRIKLVDLADKLLVGYETASQVREFTAQVRQAMDRLATVNITVHFTEEIEGGTPREATARCHFLSYISSKVDGADVVYAFDEILLVFLHDQRVYSLIELARSAKLKSGYAGRLYEIMLMYYRRHDKKWEISLEELRQVMEVGEKYPRFDHFKEYVIDKAIEEINAHAEFALNVKYERRGRGGKIDRITFTARPNDPRLIALEASGRAAAGRDRNTLDLFDGKSDSDKDMPPELASNTIAEAQRILGGSTIEAVYVERDRWFDLYGAQTYRRPDEMFLAWLQMRKDDSGQIPDVDVDALYGQLLGRTE